MLVLHFFTWAQDLCECRDKEGRLQDRCCNASRLDQRQLRSPHGGLGLDAEAGLGQELFGSMLSEQAWRAESSPQDPCKKSACGHTCNPSAGEVEEGEFLRLIGLLA